MISFPTPDGGGPIGGELWADLDPVRYFERLLNDPTGMWLFAIAVGGLALFIITRGKWR
jgi:hypothetical protein